MAEDHVLTDKKRAGFRLSMHNKQLGLGVTQKVRNNVEVIDAVNESTIETLDGLNQTGHTLDNLGTNIRHIVAKHWFARARA